LHLSILLTAVKLAVSVSLQFLGKSMPLAMNFLMNQEHPLPWTITSAQQGQMPSVNVQGANIPLPFVITCAPATLQPGIGFGSICVCVCVHLSAQNLRSYWSEIDETW